MLKGGNITSVSEALQGKLNGLVAINTSGKPGASDTKMYIRGKASWQNSAHSIFAVVCLIPKLVEKLMFGFLSCPRLVVKILHHLHLEPHIQL